AGSTAGFLIPANGYDGIRVVAGGDYLNNTASGKKITLRLAAYDTSDATLKTMWQDISPALPNAATRRAWRLRVLIQPKPRPLSGIRRMASSGFFAMSDAAAPTTGLGKLLAPATTPLWAPFTSGYDPDTPPSTVASRLQFLLTHNAVDPNLSMRCLFARVEVTS
ncbi:MAG TPA: hypothetical protein VNG33_18995, partial [Polyangiaceae bacterium]|nr:hypothetical protein [Polyangiaceae bacterium]